MRYVVLGVMALSFILVSGCQTVKNTAIGVGLVGKGIADDTYNTYKAIEKADKWFQKNYW